MLIDLILLIATSWITYLGVINCGYVSDDIDGIINYSGKPGNLSYASIFKYLLYRIYGKSNVANHLFSILIHSANSVLLYLFLTHFTSPQVSLFASLLFSVAPVGTQSIGWMSGRGYPTGLFFMLLSLNFSQIVFPLFKTAPTSPSGAFLLGGAILIYAVLYWFAIEAQFATMATFAIEFLLGNYLIGLLGVMITGFTCINVVKEVIVHRTKTFKEQNLEASTKFKTKKFVVAMKSLFYYTILCYFPKRMGLYHTYFYHYGEATEKEDKYFWMGFGLFIAMIAGIVFGSLIVKLALLWYLAYIWVFLNWITIHQFVSERYAYIPNIGLCILLALILQPFPIAFAFILGLYLMRTWVHLPTYNDEVMFYQSNVWNFPSSEVAFANLGVVYMRLQLHGSAMDMWRISTKINKEYDVAWYNMHSVLKQQGRLKESAEHLEKAVNAKCCHFKTLWTSELEALRREMRYMDELNIVNTQISELEKNPENKDKVTFMRKQLADINNLHIIVENNRKTKLTLCQQEESNLQKRMVEVMKEKEKAEKSTPVEELVKLRDTNFNLVKQSLEALLNAKVGSGIPQAGQSGKPDAD